MSLGSLRASAAYKKQDGTISISRDRHFVTWTPVKPPGATALVNISVIDIINLQKSQENNPKVSVRIVVQPATAPTPENYVFAFTSPTAARTEQAAIVDALRDVISATKAVTGSSTPNVAAETGQSAAMSIARAVVAGSKATEDEDALSDAKLISDVNLQKSLLSANSQLRQRFDEALKSKPDLIPLSQFSAQFWSSRVHLLRSHAVERSQIQGTYNVLSEVKPKNVDGAIKLNLSREQIQLIFKQHPLVRKVYDNLVPRIFSEMEFWSKFFVSKLFKKLKGEKITDMDAGIPELDRYLNYDDDSDRTLQFEIGQVPRFIDLEGNEQDHSQRLGNAPHIMMRPNPNEKVPILRALNTMSEKMMVNVAPSDAEPQAPSGMNQTAFDEFRLRDLLAKEKDHRRILHIPSQEDFFRGRHAQPSSSVSTTDPNDVIEAIKKELALGPTLLTDFDSSGRRSASFASAKIMKSVRQRLSHQCSPSDAETGLTSTRFDSTTMTHNTTVEFLHYFWSVYLSGDESRASELSKLVETLAKSLERMDAAASEAEAERKDILNKLRRQQDEYTQRTGKRRRLDLSGIRGGKDAVQHMLSATDHSVRYAEKEYKRAWREQTAQNNAEA